MGGIKVRRPLIMIVGPRIRVVLILVGLALAAGGLLSWLIGEDAPAPGNPERNSLPVTAPAEGSGIVFESENIPAPGQGENYFVNYRLEREKFRQETKAMLAALLNSTDAKTREQAQAKWLELSTKIEKESELENLLKIKGFKDAVVNVNGENVSIVVYASSLAPNEISLIQDIVVRVTKARLDRVAISYRH